MQSSPWAWPAFTQLSLRGLPTLPGEGTPSGGLSGGWTALTACPWARFPVTVALGPREACGSGGCSMGTWPHEVRPRPVLLAGEGVPSSATGPSRQPRALPARLRRRLIGWRKQRGGSGLGTRHVGKGVIGCEGQVFTLQPVLVMGGHGTGRRDPGVPTFPEGLASKMQP